MKNKILSIILLLAMVFPSIAVSAEETANEISFETQVMRGLYVVDSDFETNPDDELSRGDFVRILMDMTGAPEESTLTVAGFSDISRNASYSKAVIHAANAGYISGYEDGTFKPNNPITAAEAVTIILKVAGYDMAAVNSGGYSNGYLSLASEQDLLKGVSKNAFSPLTKEEVAKILYNTLTVEIYSLGGLTSDGKLSIEKSGELFMEARMDLKRYRGIITSDYMTSLSGDATCVQGQITIDDTVFDCEYQKAEEYLGYRVEAYTRVDNKNDEVLIYAIPYRTNVTEIKSEDITEDTTSTTVYYEVEGQDRLSRINVDADADKILNGTSDAYSSLPELAANSDRMIFIDNDDDGEAEVVIVYAYDEMYVGSVSAMDEIIYSKYTFEGVLAELELEDVDEFYILKDGVEISLSDIKADNVISVIKTESDNRTIVNINVSDTMVSGTVTGIDPEDETIYIDNREYKLSDLYYEALENNDFYAKEIEIGMIGTFYLNPFGRIAAFTADTTSKQYGFVKKAYIDDQGLDPAIKFKILGTDGDWQIYTLREKIRFNGESISAENIFINMGSNADGGNIIKPQIIEFELDNNSRIRAVNNTSAPDTGNTVDYDKFRFNRLTAIYRTANQSFDSKIYISGNTVTFSIPMLKESTNPALEYEEYTDYELSMIPDKYFLVNNGPIYSDWQTYTIDAYNCDKYGATDLIVWKTYLDDVGLLNASNFLFDRITYSASGDNTVQMTIEGLHGTNISASAPVNEDVLVYDINSELQDISYIERGDLLRLYLDVDNNVYRIDVIYKSADKEATAYSGSLHENDVTLAGTVVDVDPGTGFMILNDNKENTTLENKSLRLYTNKISVYILDSSDRKNPISIGSINDIRRGSFVLLKGGQSTFNFVVVYK